MNVCFFGTYDRGHSANRLLAQAVAASGAHLEEIHVPLWEAEPNKDRRYFSARSLAVLGRRYTASLAALRRRWRERSGPPPVVLVGFGGQLDVLVAARVCRPRRGLVFAPLVSLTETLVEDRRRLDLRKPSQELGQDDGGTHLIGWRRRRRRFNRALLPRAPAEQGSQAP